jgi:hypothetical protein
MRKWIGCEGGSFIICIEISTCPGRAKLNEELGWRWLDIKSDLRVKDYAREADNFSPVLLLDEVLKGLRESTHRTARREAFECLN